MVNKQYTCGDRFPNLVSSNQEFDIGRVFQKCLLWWSWSKVGDRILLRSSVEFLRRFGYVNQSRHYFLSLNVRRHSSRYLVIFWSSSSETFSGIEGVQYLSMVIELLTFEICSHCEPEVSDSSPRIFMRQNISRHNPSEYLEINFSEHGISRSSIFVISFDISSGGGVMTTGGGVSFFFPTL